MDAKQRATVALVGAVGGTVSVFLALRVGGDADPGPALLLGLIVGFAVGFAITYGLLSLIFRRHDG